MYPTPAITSKYASNLKLVAFRKVKLRATQPKVPVIITYNLPGTVADVLVCRMRIVSTSARLGRLQVATQNPIYMCKLFRIINLKM